MQKERNLGHVKGEAVTSPFDNTKCPQVRALIMIILNFNNFKSNQIVSNVNMVNILNIYKSSDVFYNLQCPYCNSDEFIKWGSYVRLVYYCDDYNNLKTELIEIKRVRCKKCHKTHALLPVCIVPYKQPTLDVIFKSIIELPESFAYHFSYETIQNWKYIYKRKFLPYLNTMFNNIKDLLPQVLSKIFIIYEDFFKINNSILMMNHKGIYNMAYF